MLVLIVEDHTLLREVIAGVVESICPECVIIKAGDAFEALEIILKAEPVLVISDFRMPEMNGLDLLKKVRTAFGGKFLLYSSEGYSEWLVEVAIKAGADAVLDKESSLEELEGMIRSMLPR